MNDQSGTEIISGLERATHLVRLWVERTFAGLTLTQAEAHVLAYLARQATASINDLHQHFGHKRSTLTSLLDRLEARGWVRRGPHPSSRRMVMVHLTEAGREVGDRVSVAVRELEAHVEARMGSEGIASFARVLQALEEELLHDR
jgi:DNA-binding MarR family transcriptional regulator